MGSHSFDLFVFVGSILEMTGIYNINSTIRPEHRVGICKAILVILVTALLTTVLDFLNIDYQAFLILASYILLMKVLIRRNLANIVIDTIVSYAIMFVLELPVVFLTKFLYLHPLIQPWLPYILLGALLLGMVPVKHSSSIDYACAKYYRDNSQIIAVANFFLLACMIANIYNLRSYFFNSKYLELMLIVFGYILITVLYFISTYKRAKEKEQIKIITEHQQYLSYLTDELNRRQHEYKHEINTIIGIAEQRQGDASLDAIIHYGEQIFRKKLEEETVSVVSDNTIVAALIYRFNKMADQSNIEFSYYIEEPFPTYPLTEFELIEILSNLLMNAFEAVAGLNHPMVIIKLEEHTIEMINSVEETFGEDCIIRFGRKYSTKGPGHGFGLQNVFKIIHKRKISTDIYLEGRNLHFLLRFN